LMYPWNRHPAAGECGGVTARPDQWAWWMTPLMLTPSNMSW